MNKSRERVRLACFECGSIFKDNFREKHEFKHHGGKNMKI